MEQNQNVKRMAYSVAQVAEMLTLSSRTVHTLIKNGDLACFRVGVRVLISESALTEFIATRTKGGAL